MTIQVPQQAHTPACLDLPGRFCCLLEFCASPALVMLLVAGGVAMRRGHVCSPLSSAGMAVGSEGAKLGLTCLAKEKKAYVWGATRV